MNDLIVLEKIAQWPKLKALVLDSVSSPITKRVYNMALEKYMIGSDWRRARASPKLQFARGAYPSRPAAWARRRSSFGCRRFAIKHRRQQSLTLWTGHRSYLFFRLSTASEVILCPNPHRSGRHLKTNLECGTRRSDIRESPW